MTRARHDTTRHDKCGWLGGWLSHLKLKATRPDLKASYQAGSLWKKFLGTPVVDDSRLRLGRLTSPWSTRAAEKGGRTITVRFIL